MTDIKLLAMLILVLTVADLSAQLKAFPGAEGFGAYARGGRGGAVISVTNLNDEGPGSLRAACEAQGARIIIFRTGGTIQLKNDIYITKPYLTLAGQTAPGDGILIRGAAIRPSSHDIIIRGLRFRVGDAADGPVFSNRDGLGIENPGTAPKRIIIDHCSFSWATDENIVTWYASNDLTIQWCIISEALLSSDGENSYGALFGYEVDRLSVLHNLFAHNRGRNPLAQGGPSRFEIINNFIYNWGVQPLAFESEKNGPCRANIIGNYMLPGPSTSFGWISKGIWLKTSGGGALHSESSFYVQDNIGPGRLNEQQDDWDAIDGPINYRSTEPIMPFSECSIFPATELQSIILDNAGATIPDLDPVDRNIINDVKTTQGRLLEAFVSELPYPSLNPGSYPADADRDGMPDEWERQRGLNPDNPTDAQSDRNGDGYPNIEEYINFLIPVISELSIAVQRPKNIRVINSK